MSDMVKYRAVSFKKDQIVALYFTMSDMAHCCLIDAAMFIISRPWIRSTPDSGRSQKYFDKTLKFSRDVGRSEYPGSWALWWEYSVPRLR